MMMGSSVEAAQQGIECSLQKGKGRKAMEMEEVSIYVHMHMQHASFLCCISIFPSRRGTASKDGVGARRKASIPVLSECAGWQKPRFFSSSSTSCWVFFIMVQWNVHGLMPCLCLGIHTRTPVTTIRKTRRLHNLGECPMEVHGLGSQLVGSLMDSCSPIILIAAKFLNLQSPVPFNSLEGNLPSNGVNFAYGGSGLFYTYGPEYINISVQIDQFQKLSAGKHINYQNSLVLFVYGGNDYSIHLQKYGPRGIPFFIAKVVSRISTELNRLHKIGFRNFAVTNLEPAGCLPFITMPKSMNNCSRRDNVLSSVHNRFLAQTLINLRTFRGRNSKYILLDQYKSFLEVLSSSSKYGFSEELVLHSCCQGIKNGAGCGSVDERGNALYTKCADSSRTFFWDGAHPTQAGWAAVTQHYEAILNSF